MALIFMEGFDAKDMPLKWNGNSPNSTSVGRLGTGFAASFSSNTPVKQLFQQLSTTYIGFAYMTNGFGGTSHGLVLRGDAGVNSHISVELNTTSISLLAGRYGATLATAVGSYIVNTWYYIEIGAVLATSGGTCQVRVNGAQVINFTGNTMNGGTNTTVDAFEIGTANVNTTDTLDDLYVCDATGSTNNTFLGDVRIQTLFPTGAGSSTALTPTGNANNWQNVDDVPDSTANYNASAVTGTRDTYAMGDVLASTGTIFGAQTSMHAFKTDSGSANMKAALKSGSTLVYESTQVLGVSNTWSGAMHQQDPNTSAAWTPAGINAVEFGGEVA